MVIESFFESSLHYIYWLFGCRLGLAEDSRTTLSGYKLSWSGRCYWGWVILIGGKGFEQRGVFGEMRQQAKLDLGIVGAENTTGFVRWDESGADFSTHLCPHGNVLQVRVGGRQSPCRRYRLVE